MPNRITRLQSPVSPAFITQVSRTTRLPSLVSPAHSLSPAFITQVSRTTRLPFLLSPVHSLSQDPCLRLPVNLVHFHSQEPFPDLLLASPVHSHSPDLFLRLLRASPSLRLPASLVSRKLLAKL